MIYANEDKYDGEWKNDERNGKGSYHIKVIGALIHANGDKFTGQWENNKKEGEGTYVIKVEQEFTCMIMGTSMKVIGVIMRRMEKVLILYKGQE